MIQIYFFFIYKQFFPTIMEIFFLNEKHTWPTLLLFFFFELK